MPQKSKKCVSICKSFEKAECNPPRCNYIDKTRKYCRLSHKYKMNKSNCNITRRIKKKDIVANATKRISRFIKSSKLFLNAICPKSGMCLAFGKSVDEINKYFNGFTNFDYVTNTIKPIGGESANGFVYEIEYDKNNYKAYSILKSAKSSQSDNLAYEYLVGIKYINRKLKSFPCFVQTYGLYFYDSRDSWVTFARNAIKFKKKLDTTNLTHLLLQNKIDYKKACTESNYTSLLIQHIHNAKSIHDSLKDKDFIENDLLYMAFIVYQALSSLSKTFTHYDLHGDNVLLYKAMSDHYIEYHYHYTDGTKNSFFSSYVPKIIDYGRSYFNNGNIKSPNIHNQLCKTKECNPNCGEIAGFVWLNPTPYQGISSSKKNESHDLRLLNGLKRLLSATNKASPALATLKLILSNIVYGEGISDNAEKHFGTDENLTNDTNRTFKSSGNFSKIYNVNGAFSSLKLAIEMPAVINANNSWYSKQTKMGDLHIYEDGRSQTFTPII